MFCKKKLKNKYLLLFPNESFSFLQAHKFNLKTEQHVLGLVYKRVKITTLDDDPWKK